jgi:inositol-pentakisphosphate 2-kinase
LTEAAIIEASQWRYMSEGARNVVVGHESNGTVLRLAKVRNRNSRSVLHSSAAFLDRLLEHLGRARYAIVGAPVLVSPQFCTELDARIRSARPASRVDKALDVAAGTALQLPNMAAGNVLCVELKPKWCFLPESSDDAVKLRCCRFCMHQRLKVALGEVSRLSNYCPLALSSTNATSVRRALVALLRTPQNNLRLFVDGDALGGGGDDSFVLLPSDNDADDDVVLLPAMHDALCAVFGADLCGAVAGESTRFLIDIVSETLLESAVLRDIRDVQRLGADVAVVVQRRDDAALLDRFMTSCVLKDCSVLLTFARRDAVAASEEYEPMRANERVARRVAIIDLDQKAVEELDRYHKLDREIVANFVAQVGEQQQFCECDQV